MRVGLVSGLVIGLAAMASRAEPTSRKPPDGPGAREATPRAKTEAEKAEEAAHQAYSERVEARNRADLMRAAYEKANRPGATPEGAVKQFEEVVAAYRAAIDLGPTSAEATDCRVRLAGAYMYTGAFDAATRVMQEAVNVAAGPREQVVACHAMGMHQLQALHRPGEALRWFDRAQQQVPKIEDDNERAKWAAAVAQGITRCDEGK
jgi:tetratricopeptide (TPR) repeat protein